MYFLDENINKQRKYEGSHPSVVWVPLNAGRTVGPNNRGNIGSFNAERSADQLELGEWFDNRGVKTAFKTITTDSSGTYSVNLTPTSYNTVYRVKTALGVGTLVLPPVAESVGYSLTIKKVDTGTNAITIDGNGSETIDGAATLATLDAQWDVVTIACDGTEWFITSSNIA